MTISSSINKYNVRKLQTTSSTNFLNTHRKLLIYVEAIKDIRQKDDMKLNQYIKIKYINQYTYEKTKNSF